MSPRCRDAQNSRVKQILTATIVDLCNAILRFDSEMKIDCLIGLTIDQKDVLLISFNETYFQGIESKRARHSEISSPHSTPQGPPQLSSARDSTNSSPHSTHEGPPQLSSALDDDGTASSSHTSHSMPQSPPQLSQVPGHLNQLPSASSQPRISRPGPQSASSRMQSASWQSAAALTQSSTRRQEVRKPKKSQFRIIANDNNNNDTVARNSSSLLDASSNTAQSESPLTVKTEPMEAESSTGRQQIGTIVFLNSTRDDGATRDNDASDYSVECNDRAQNRKSSDTMEERSSLNRASSSMGLLVRETCKDAMGLHERQSNEERVGLIEANGTKSSQHDTRNVEGKDGVGITRSTVEVGAGVGEDENKSQRKRMRNESGRFIRVAAGGASKRSEMVLRRATGAKLIRGKRKIKPTLKSIKHSSTTKLITCPKCFGKYKTRGIVKKHLKRVHGLTPVNHPTTGANPYYPGCTLREMEEEEKRTLIFERNRDRRAQGIMKFGIKKRRLSRDSTAKVATADNVDDAIVVSVKRNPSSSFNSVPETGKIVARERECSTISCDGRSSASASVIECSSTAPDSATVGDKGNSKKPACPKCFRLFHKFSSVKEHLFIKHDLCPVVNIKGFKPYTPGCVLRKITNEEITLRALHNGRYVATEKMKKAVVGSSSIETISKSKEMVARESARPTCPKCFRSFHRFDLVKEHLLLKHNLFPVVNSKGFNPYKPGCILRKATNEDFAPRFRNNKRIATNKRTKTLLTAIKAKFNRARERSNKSSTGAKAVASSSTETVSESKEIVTDASDSAATPTCPKCFQTFNRFDYVKDHLLLKHNLCPVVNAKGFNPFKPGCVLRSSTNEDLVRRFKNMKLIAANVRTKTNIVKVKTDNDTSILNESLKNVAVSGRTSLNNTSSRLSKPSVRSSIHISKSAATNVTASQNATKSATKNIINPSSINNSTRKCAKTDIILSCPKCGQAFARIDNIKSHLIRVHGLVPVKDASGKNPYHPGCVLKRANAVKINVGTKVSNTKLDTSRSKKGIEVSSEKKAQRSERKTIAAKFQCPKCSREFCGLDTFKLHLVLKHTLIPDNIVRGVKFSATDCVFRTATALEIGHARARTLVNNCKSKLKY